MLQILNKEHAIIISKMVLKSKAKFDKGRQDGVTINYNSQGDIISLQTFKNGYLTADEKINRRDKFGLKQGAWKAFYDNMQIKSEGVWDDDKKNGVFKEYTADGQILKTEVYKNDELLVATYRSWKVEVQNNIMQMEK
ncbi:MAG: hypothetical protein IPP29_02980 [Bacteroidetes bacterium]|nr:hypothetical protein [Bacteroidota bacterium]